jgi:hypothetical protein
MGEQFISGFLYGSWTRGNLLRLVIKDVIVLYLFVPGLAFAF